LTEKIFAFSTIVLTSLYHWIVITILIKLNSVDEAGDYIWALSIMSPFSVFLLLGLRQLYLSDKDDTYTIGIIIKYRFYATLLFFIISLIIILFKSSDILVILSVGLIKVVEMLSDIFFPIYQKQNQILRGSISQTIKILISVFIILSFSFLGVNIFVGLIISALVNLFLCCYDYFYIKNSYNVIFLKSEKNGIFRFFKTSVSLALTSTLHSLSTNIPRYFINAFYGNKLLVVYSTIGYFSNSIILLFNSLIDLNQIKLAEYYRSSGNKVNYTIFKIFLFSLVSILLIFLIYYNYGELLLKYASNENFIKYKYLLLFSLFPLFFDLANKLLSNWILAINKLEMQLISYFVSVIIIFCSCIYFIKYNSVQGAFIATACSGIFLILFLSLIIKRYYAKGFS